MEDEGSLGGCSFLDLPYTNVVPGPSDGGCRPGKLSLTGRYLMVVVLDPSFSTSGFVSQKESFHLLRILVSNVSNTLYVLTSTTWTFYCWTFKQFVYSLSTYVRGLPRETPQDKCLKINAKDNFNQEVY